jgi:hypothetical protein
MFKQAMRVTGPVRRVTACSYRSSIFKTAARENSHLGELLISEGDGLLTGPDATGY